MITRMFRDIDGENNSIKLDDLFGDVEDDAEKGTGMYDIKKVFMMYNLLFGAILSKLGGMKLLGLGVDYRLDPNRGDGGISIVKDAILGCFNCNMNFVPHVAAYKKVRTTMVNAPRDMFGKKNRRASFIAYTYDEVVRRFELSHLFATMIGTCSRLSSAMGNLVSVTVSSQGTHLDMSNLQNMLVDCISFVKQYVQQYYDYIPTNLRESLLSKDEKVSIYYNEKQLGDLFESHLSDKVKYPPVIDMANTAMTQLHISMINDYDSIYSEDIMSSPFMNIEYTDDLHKIFSGHLSIMPVSAAITRNNYGGNAILSCLVPSHQVPTAVNRHKVRSADQSSLFKTVVCRGTPRPGDTTASRCPSLLSTEEMSRIFILDDFSNCNSVSALIPALNYGIKTMLHSFFDIGTQKIYQGLITRMLSTKLALNVEKLETSYPDMFYGNTKAEGDAFTGTHVNYAIPSKDALLTTSNAMLLRDLYQQLNPKTEAPVFLLSALTDVRNQGLLDVFRLKLPMFREYFLRLINKCKMIRAFMTKGCGSRKNKKHLIRVMCPWGRLLGGNISETSIINIDQLPIADMTVTNVSSDDITLEDKISIYGAMISQRTGAYIGSTGQLEAVQHGTPANPGPGPGPVAPDGRKYPDYNVLGPLNPSIPQAVSNVLKSLDPVIGRGIISDLKFYRQSDEELYAYFMESVSGIEDVAYELASMCDEIYKEYVVDDKFMMSNIGSVPQRSKYDRLYVPLSLLTIFTSPAQSFNQLHSLEASRGTVPFKIQYGAKGVLYGDSNRLINEKYLEGPVNVIKDINSTSKVRIDVNKYMAFAKRLVDLIRFNFSLIDYSEVSAVTTGDYRSLDFKGGAGYVDRGVTGGAFEMRYDDHVVKMIESFNHLPTISRVISPYQSLIRTNLDKTEGLLKTEGLQGMIGDGGESGSSDCYGQYVHRIGPYTVRKITSKWPQYNPYGVWIIEWLLDLIHGGYTPGSGGFKAGFTEKDMKSLQEAISAVGQFNNMPLTKQRSNAPAAELAGYSKILQRLLSNQSWKGSTYEQTILKYKEELSKLVFARLSTLKSKEVMYHEDPALFKSMAFEGIKEFSSRSKWPDRAITEIYDPAWNYLTSGVQWIYEYSSDIPDAKLKQLVDKTVTYMDVYKDAITVIGAIPPIVPIPVAGVPISGLFVPDMDGNYLNSIDNGVFTRKWNAMYAAQQRLTMSSTGSLSKTLGILLQNLIIELGLVANPMGVASPGNGTDAPAAGNAGAPGTPESSGLTWQHWTNVNINTIAQLLVLRDYILNYKILQHRLVQSPSKTLLMEYFQNYLQPQVHEDLNFGVLNLRGLPWEYPTGVFGRGEFYGVQGVRLDYATGSNQLTSPVSLPLVQAENNALLNLISRFGFAAGTIGANIAAALAGLPIDVLARWPNMGVDMDIFRWYYIFATSTGRGGLPLPPDPNTGAVTRPANFSQAYTNGDLYQIFGGVTPPVILNPPVPTVPNTFRLSTVLDHLIGPNYSGTLIGTAETMGGVQTAYTAALQQYHNARDALGTTGTAQLSLQNLPIIRNALVTGPADTLAEEVRKQGGELNYRVNTNGFTRPTVVEMREVSGRLVNLYLGDNNAVYTANSQSPYDSVPRPGSQYHWTTFDVANTAPGPPYPIGTFFGGVTGGGGSAFTNIFGGATSMLHNYSLLKYLHDTDQFVRNLYTSSSDFTMAQVLDIMDSDSFSEVKQVLVQGVYLDDGPGGCSKRSATAMGDKNQLDTLIRMIIELNINPINVHSMQRFIPFANIYNYSYTLDRFVYTTYNVSKTWEDLMKPDNQTPGQILETGYVSQSILTPPNVDTPPIVIDGIKRAQPPGYERRWPIDPVENTKIAFIKMFIDPYARVDPRSYGTPATGNAETILRAPIGQILRGYDHLGMGVPKFLSDQLLGKALLGSMYVGGMTSTSGVGNLYDNVTTVNPALMPYALDPANAPNTMDHMLLGGAGGSCPGVDPLNQVGANFGDLTDPNLLGHVREWAPQFSAKVAGVDGYTPTDILLMRYLSFYDTKQHKVKTYDLWNVFQPKRTLPTDITALAKIPGDPFPSGLSPYLPSLETIEALREFHYEGYERFNTQLVRNVILISNLQRFMRYTLSSWLTRAYNLVERGHKTVAAEVTERRPGNDLPQGPDETYSRQVAQWL